MERPAETAAALREPEKDSIRNATALAACPVPVSKWVKEVEDAWRPAQWMDFRTG